MLYFKNRPGSHPFLQKVNVTASWLEVPLGFGRSKFRFPLCLWRLTALHPHVRTLIVMHALAFSSLQPYSCSSYYCFIIMLYTMGKLSKRKWEWSTPPSLPNPRQIYSLALCKPCLVQRQETWMRILWGSAQAAPFWFCALHQRIVGKTAVTPASSMLWINCQRLCRSWSAKCAMQTLAR